MHDNVCVMNEDDNTYSINYLNSNDYNSYFSYILSIYNIDNIFENTKIKFKCSTFQTFKDYLLLNGLVSGSGGSLKLSYVDVIKLIYDIGVLIKSLELYNLYIICFCMEDFLIIDNSIFLFVNVNKIVKKSNISDNIRLSYPISLYDGLSFISKDIDVSVLPLECHYSYSYYNFGLMVIYLLTGDLYDEVDSNNVLSLLLPYVGSRLYYFLLRCLNKDMNERCFLYI